MVHRTRPSKFHDDPDVLSVPRPTSVYGATKLELAQEQIIKAWTAATSADTSALCLQHVSPPGQSIANRSPLEGLFAEEVAPRYSPPGRPHRQLRGATVVSSFRG